MNKKEQLLEIIIKNGYCFELQCNECILQIGCGGPLETQRKKERACKLAAKYFIEDLFEEIL